MEDIKLVIRKQLSYNPLLIHSFGILISCFTVHVFVSYHTKYLIIQSRLHFNVRSFVSASRDNSYPIASSKIFPPNQECFINGKRQKTKRQLFSCDPVLLQ